MVYFDGGFRLQHPGHAKTTTQNLFLSQKNVSGHALFATSTSTGEEHFFDFQI